MLTRRAGGVQRPGGLRESHRRFFPYLRRRHRRSGGHHQAGPPVPNPLRRELRDEDGGAYGGCNQRGARARVQGSLSFLIFRFACFVDTSAPHHQRAHTRVQSPFFLVFLFFASFPLDCLCRSCGFCRFLRRSCHCRPECCATRVVLEAPPPPPVCNKIPSSFGLPVDWKNREWHSFFAREACFVTYRRSFSP